MQNDATVGRLLLASFHQAIGEVLPARLEFYERWLDSSEHGAETLGVASFMAMLSFLQQEGHAADIVTSRAGQYAAVRTFGTLPAVKRSYFHVLPRRLRARKVVRLAAGMLPALYPESRIDTTSRGGTVFINIDGSPFCAARGADDEPSCSFYASAVLTFLRLFHLRAAVRVSRCRASGSKSCLLMVLPDVARSVTAEGSILSRDDLAATSISSATISIPTEPPVEIAIAETATEHEVPIVCDETPLDGGPAAVAAVPQGRSEIEARWDAIAAIPRVASMLRKADAQAVGPAAAGQDPEAPWHRL